VRYRLILFDLDGTLVDSLPDIAAALNHALRARGLQTLPSEVVRTLVGDGIVVLAERALAQQSTPPDVDAATLANEALAYYEQHPCVHTRLYDGILETLRALRPRHIAVLTNKHGALSRTLLANLPVAEHLDAIIGDGDGLPRKPAPDAALSLVQRFGVSPTETLMVGDGLPDLAVAKAACIHSAAALWGYTPRARLEAERPDHVLRSPAELLGIA
jgi:phosphoglycolate phosphatase